MKTNYLKLTILTVILLFFSGCFFYPNTAVLHFTNHSAGRLNVIIDIEGRDPDPQGGEGSTFDIEVEFPVFSDSVDVDLTIDGDFKSEEQLSFTLIADEKKDFVINPDQGRLTILYYGDEDISSFWMVTEDPLTYTSITQLDNEAAYIVPNITQNNHPAVSCDPGTYYAVFQTAVDFYYDSAAVAVSINQDSSIDLNPTVHPGL